MTLRLLSKTVIVSIEIETIYTIYLSKYYLNRRKDNKFVNQINNKI